jgi:hypothetical protein
MAGWWSIEVFHGEGDEPVVQLTGRTPPGVLGPAQAGAL